MKKNMVQLEIAITISEFGSLKKFYKTFAKGNREIIVENIEFEGHPDQHNSGVLREKFELRVKNKKKIYPELSAHVENFLDKNNLHGECFSIRDLDTNKELFTEDDF